MTVWCGCGRKFGNEADQRAHQLSFPAPSVHNLCTKPIFMEQISQLEDHWKKLPKRRHKKKDKHFSATDIHIREIVAAGARIFIDIDELREVNIYIEGSDDERLLVGTYETIVDAVNAAYTKHNRGWEK